MTPAPLLVSLALLVSALPAATAAAEPAPVPPAAPVLASAATQPAQPAPTGTWYAQLRPVEGLEIGFAIRIETASAGAFRGELLNGAIAIPFSSVAWDGKAFVLDLAHLDARLTAEPSADGSALSGSFTRVLPSGRAESTFAASRKAPPVPQPAASAPSVAGEWGAEVGEGEKAEKLLATFRQKGGSVAGSFLDPSGDGGPYHGTWDGKGLVLSVFDGVHAVRVEAALGPDGRLVGTRRDRSGKSVRLVLRRLSKAEEAAFLPDAFGVTRPKDRTAPFAFSLPDVDGKTVSSTDARFSGKPMLVVFSGTWCPNCNDEAPVTQELQSRYAARGLQVVTLFYEYTDDAQRSARQVKRFAERYGLTGSLLLAGTTKNARSTAPLQQIDGFSGYPTTLFLDRTHRVVRIHAGFDGPATGERFTRLKQELDEAVRTLVE